MGRIKHGGCLDRLYRIWIDMKARCYNPNNKRFHCYGGRGIKVCEEWRDDFAAFRDYALANGYDDDLTIDRINVNGDYSPENCRWVTIGENVRASADEHRATREALERDIIKLGYVDRRKAFCALQALNGRSQPVPNPLEIDQAIMKEIAWATPTNRRIIYAAVRAMLADAGEGK